VTALHTEDRRIQHSGVAGKPLDGGVVGEPVVRRFRPDIQGLRAIAILLVVLYHAHVPGIEGGYVGVDVFFVISGYLITGQLVGEVARSGRLSLPRFYLKRVRRLLPSAVIVIISTLCAARAFAPPLLSRSLSVDGIFAALYTLNYRLAVEGINYQNAGAAPSAFQHFWSLGVEEQFYLFWPLLIVFAVMLAKRWWRDLLAVFVLAVAVVSLYISQYLLAADAPMSYFSVQSRAWEFGAGAIAALASGMLAHIRPNIRTWISASGLAVIIFTGVFYTDATQFPGIHALVPVLGAVLVISAGCGSRLRSEAILDNHVMQWLGKVSYPWYLWHWPILVLAPYIWPRATFTWITDLGLMAFALILAAATYYALELPVRKIPFNLAVWATAGLTLMSAAVATGSYIDSSETALLASSGVTPPPAALTPVKHGTKKRAAVDPFTSRRTSGPVYPSVLKAGSDTPDYPADCFVLFAATTSPECLIGPGGNAMNTPVGPNRVVLLGDSHAGEWYPDVYGVARQFGWDTEVLTKEGCPLATITIQNATLDQPYRECNQWRANMFQRLLSEPRPRVIFIASLNYYTANNTYLANGWKKTLQALRAVGAPIVYLHDTPYPNFDVPTCVSGALDDWSKCSFQRAIAFHPDPLMSGTAASHGLAARVNVDQYLCPPAKAECPAVLGGILLYRDNSHVTNTAMSMLLPIVQKQLQPLVQSILNLRHPNHE
jgi:peptidoglycan/LPS O-acetylase OafA/YrhL